MEYLLLKQHVSALALGHHQVSNCASEETIQCSIRIAHIIQRDLVDNVTIGPLRHNSRPDDGPVQVPKHVVLVINTPLPY